MHRYRFCLVAIACAALVGCSPGNGAGAENPTTTPTATTATATEAPATGEETIPWPGEGAVMSVVGVAQDDVLYVRAEPDPSAEVIHQFAPISNDVMVAGGENVQRNGQIWSRVTVSAIDREGWVNSRYISQQGQTNDITSELPKDLVADSMPALAELVVQQRASDPAPRVVVVDTPGGDLENIVVDALGYADDAQYGERLSVFALPDGDRWRLRTVEATTWCSRGVTEDKLCV